MRVDATIERIKRGFVEVSWVFPNGTKVSRQHSFPGSGWADAGELDAWLASEFQAHIQPLLTKGIRPRKRLQELLPVTRSLDV